MKKGKSAVSSGGSVGLQMVTQYFVHFAPVGTQAGTGTYDEYGNPIMMAAPIGKKGAAKLKLPNVVQASSFIEAVQKIDKFMLDNDLNGKYTISRLEENRQSTSILV